MTVSPLFSNKMAVKMVLFWFSLVLSIIGLNAASQFTILHHPDSISFEGSEEIRETMLNEAFCAALGMSTQPHKHWSGLYVNDPFNMPEAGVEVYVDGVESLGSFGKNAKTYPLIVDQYEPDTFESIRDRIQERFPGDDNNKLVNIRLSDSYDLRNYAGIFGEISDPKVPKDTLQHLKLSIEEDYQFLTELQALRLIIASIKPRNIKADNQVDFYNFRFSSLHALSDYHGANSLATKEAKKLLKDEIEALNAAFVRAYDGNVVVAAVSSDVAHTRRTARAVKQNDDTWLLNTDETTTSDSIVFDDATIAALISNDNSSITILIRAGDAIDSIDYPVIFNIILWFSVVMVFTMVAIVYAIMDMDPGRDSIIYRMTSTRIKKDN